jgi:hypothetical protein
MMAGLGVVESITKGMYELGTQTLDAATDADSEVTWRHVAENLARNMPNRAVKGALTVMVNDGRDISASGEIVSETQSSFETGLRVLGLRSGRQQGEVEAYYANTTMRRRLAGRMEKLREQTRSLIRSGEPYDPMQIFNQYVENGGSATHFRQWINEQIKATTSSRGMKSFTESLRNPNTQLEAWRYDMR